jgi:hypothetical protein
MSNVASGFAIRTVLDQPNMAGSTIDFHTHTGSVYTVEHGKVTGGKFDAPKNYTRIEMVPFVLHGEVTHKLGFHDDYGRLLLTSPIVRIVVTYV